MHEMIDPIVNFLVNFIHHVGYLGIFIGMFIESTAFPLPSELIVIPAGIAASQGHMDLLLIILVGTCGNVAGAVFSYYLAEFAGRTFLFRIGKYFFVKPEAIIKVEEYFKNHGPISVFIARLLPGFRHFISLPAGIAKMDIKLFYFYTTVGSLLWTTVLAILGYEIGENKEMIKEYIHTVILVCVGLCIAIAAFYYFYKKCLKKTTASF